MLPLFSKVIAYNSSICLPNLAVLSISHDRYDLGVTQRALLLHLLNAQFQNHLTDEHLPSEHLKSSITLLQMLLSEVE
jgi:hypothetical protein